MVVPTFFALNLTERIVLLVVVLTPETLPDRVAPRTKLPGASSRRAERRRVESVPLLFKKLPSITLGWIPLAEFPS